ncbi:hypothetical protein HJ01_01252 [Flavobacterium frigoris PS1]|uniref:Uncharacterized protein n=1 Tax=Flavobacterium frigoris (strain PS1) TaxID=1086011 RepID=H7FPZ2_FLAFP|nr:hypothetical protein HJ01_01252 [Flavobacterium frigoris PS1]
MNPTKNHIFPLLLLLATALCAQDNTRNEYQKKLFNDTQETLEIHDYVVVARLFAFVHNMNQKSEIAQIALKKADSLKSIFRKNKVKSLIGNWKWISKDPDWVIRDDGLVGKMITINTDEMLFFELYRNSKKWKLVKTEKIKFSKNPESYSFTEVLYSNSQVWDYNIDKDTGELTALYIGDKIEEGYSEMICGTLVLYYFKLQ